MPVAVDPKSRDAVYRAVGRAGVVLIGEGSSARLRQIVEDEKRKVSRAIPGVTVSVLSVNDQPGSVPLYALTKAIYKLEKTLSRAEISVVNKRLAGLGLNIPIPKGIDPNRMRAGRRM
jgi:electron transfer flavoprotein alpha/beta subunit